MRKLIILFWLEEQGQDITEYSLLLAFVCVAAAALFIPTSTNIMTIWGVSSNQMSSAAQAASTGVS